jgi:hypothetical protein
MGMRQLKMHEGCDVTCGRAVMLYSGEEEVGAETDELLGVEDTDDWAVARATRRKRMKNFIVGDEEIELNMAQLEEGKRRAAFLR